MKPRFKIGDRVQTNYKSIYIPDAVFTVSWISADHGSFGDHRYWGEDDRGDAFWAYEDRLRLVKR